MSRTDKISSDHIAGSAQWSQGMVVSALQHFYLITQDKCSFHLAWLWSAASPHCCVLLSPCTHYIGRENHLKKKLSWCATLLSGTDFSAYTPCSLATNQTQLPKMSDITGQLRLSALKVTFERQVWHSLEGLLMYWKNSVKHGGARQKEIWRRICRWLVWHGGHTTCKEEEKVNTVITKL